MEIGSPEFSIVGPIRRCMKSGSLPACIGVSAHYACSSASAEKVEQGEVGGVTRKVTYTWWLLGLSVKAPWLGPGGPILALAAWTGLENATITL